MNDIIFDTEGLKVLASFGKTQSIKKDVRKNIDYICHIDLEGHQVWKLNTGKDPVDSMVKKNHSGVLGKISKDITLWLLLSLAEQRRKEQRDTTQNEPGEKIIPITERKPLQLQLLEREQKYKKDDFMYQRRREEDTARQNEIVVKRDGGVLGLLGAI